MLEKELIKINEHIKKGEDTEYWQGRKRQLLRKFKNINNKKNNS